MKDGFPGYKCYVQSKKTRTNLYDTNIEEFVFCGAVLNVNTMGARPDFGPYEGRNIVYAVKFNIYPKMNEFEYNESLSVVVLPLLRFYFYFFRFLLKKMLFIVTLKLDHMFIDPDLNGSDSVKFNVFQTFRVAALRCNALLA